MVAPVEVTIDDLIPQPIKVMVTKDKYLSLTPLTFEQIVTLLLGFRDEFVALYSTAMASKPTYEQFMLTSPLLVANIIAMSAGFANDASKVAKLPGTVQLVAIAEILRASVPDPKKLRESLSEVMALLRSASNENQEQQLTPPESSPLT